MSGPHDPFAEDFARPIRAAIEAETKRREHRQAAPPPPVLPFVTISRQAGARGRTLARRLVERLNGVDPGPEPWTCWDKELVEKVATESHIPESLLQSLEDSRRTWFQAFLDGLSFSDERPTEDEFKAYRRVAASIRALAEIGRTVIVGRAGVFLTGNLPGGLHVRLVAPLEYRIRHMAELLQVNPEEAARQVRLIERARTAFYRRYWPGRQLEPEVFSVTFNCAGVEDEEMVEATVPLVLGRYQPRRKGAMA